MSVVVETLEALGNFILRLIRVDILPLRQPLESSDWDRAGNWPGFSHRSSLGDEARVMCTRDIGFALSPPSLRVPKWPLSSALAME